MPTGAITKVEVLTLSFLRFIPTMLRMPEAKREAIIIAQERMIKELRDQNLEMAKNNLKGMKKVKAEVS